MVKKIIFFLLLCVSSFLLICCDNEVDQPAPVYKVIFYNGSDVIKEVEFKKGDKIEYPEVNIPEGYYYAWDKELPTEIDNNYIISLELFEKTKEYKYIISGEVVDTRTVKYSEEVVNYPYGKEDWVDSFTWDEEFLGEEDNVLKYTRTLNKKGKEYTIKLYDGNNLLDIEPKSYVAGSTTTLPIPKKDGYEFIGWFVSDISLYRYYEIGPNSYGNVVLYARFLETVKHERITLPNATAHITKINKIAHSSGNGTFVYQPQLPGGVPQSAGTYNWSSSDETIATISQYSSITGKKAGCCIITGVSQTDSSIVINGIIQVTGDGITSVTEEEANVIELCTVTFLDRDDNVIETQHVVKGGSVIYPIPPVVQNYAFTGWDRVNYNIKADTTIRATYKRGTNNYQGKKFSIIGDSISTYQDYIPAGYACFYPYPTADVNDVNMTWWMMAVNKLGAGLFINNSYSGSCASSGTGASASSNQTRLNKLVVNNERPDVIIIYMGSNDCASKYVTIDDFSSGYKETITKTMILCPDAEIILCTLPISKLYTEENRVAYNEVILEYANKYELKVCDLGSIDISNDLVDSAHPKTSGMKIVANKIVEELLK